MNIKKQTPLVLNRDLFTDEDLIKAHREGDEDAGSALLTRYVTHQKAITLKAVPELYSFLKNWDVNAIYFNSFQAALRRYDFRYKFTTLFCACLRNAAKRAYREVTESQGGLHGLGVLSLDDHINNDDDAPAIIDMMPDTSYRSNVVAQATDRKLLEDIEKLPINEFDPYTYVVASSLIQGMRVAEIARKFQIDRKRVDRIIAKLKRYLWSREDLDIADRYDFD